MGTWNDFHWEIELRDQTGYWRPFNGRKYQHRADAISAIGFAEKADRLTLRLVRVIVAETREVDEIRLNTRREV